MNTPKYKIGQKVTDQTGLTFTIASHELQEDFFSGGEEWVYRIVGNDLDHNTVEANIKPVEANL